VQSLQSQLASDGGDRGETGRLKAELLEAAAKCTRLAQNLARVEYEKDQTRKQLHTAQKRAEDIAAHTRVQFEELEDFVAAAKAAGADATSRADEAERLRDIARSGQDDAEALLRASRESLSAATAKLSEERAKWSDELDRVRSDLQATRSNASEAASRATLECARLNEVARSANEAVREMELAGASSDLRDKIAAAQSAAELCRLRGESQAAQSALQALRDEYSTNWQHALAENSDLRSQLKHAQRELEAALTDARQLASSKDVVESTLGRDKSALAAARAELAKLSAELGGEKDAVFTLSEQISDLRRELSSVTSAASISKTLHEQASTRMASLTADLSQARSDLDSTRSRAQRDLSEARETAQRHERDASSLRSDTSSLRQERDRLQQRLDIAASDQKSLQSAFDGKSRELSTSQEEARRAQQDNGWMLQELDSLRELRQRAQLAFTAQEELAKKSTSLEEELTQHLDLLKKTQAEVELLTAERELCVAEASEVAELREDDLQQATAKADTLSAEVATLIADRARLREDMELQNRELQLACAKLENDRQEAHASRSAAEVRASAAEEEASKLLNVNRLLLQVASKRSNGGDERVLGIVDGTVRVMPAPRSQGRAPPIRPPSASSSPVKQAAPQDETSVDGSPRTKNPALQLGAGPKAPEAGPRITMLIDSDSDDERVPTSLVDATDYLSEAIRECAPGTMVCSKTTDHIVQQILAAARHLFPAIMAPVRFVSSIAATLPAHSSGMLAMPLLHNGHYVFVAVTVENGAYAKALVYDSSPDYLAADRNRRVSSLIGDHGRYEILRRGPQGNNDCAFWVAKSLLEWLDTRMGCVLNLPWERAAVMPSVVAHWQKQAAIATAREASTAASAGPVPGPIAIVVPPVTPPTGEFDLLSSIVNDTRAQSALVSVTALAAFPVPDDAPRERMVMEVLIGLVAMAGSGQQCRVQEGDIACTRLAVATLGVPLFVEARESVAKRLAGYRAQLDEAAAKRFADNISLATKGVPAWAVKLVLSNLATPMAMALSRVRSLPGEPVSAAACVACTKQIVVTGAVTVAGSDTEYLVEKCWQHHISLFDPVLKRAYTNIPRTAASPVFGCTCKEGGVGSGQHASTCPFRTRRFASGQPGPADSQQTVGEIMARRLLEASQAPDWPQWPRWPAHTAPSR
jgi:hypothetical protein